MTCNTNRRRESRFDPLGVIPTPALHEFVLVRAEFGIRLNVIPDAPNRFYRCDK